MHKNTYRFLIGLAIFAALVAGVNIGRRISGNTAESTIPPTPEATPTPISLIYTNTACGFTLRYTNKLSLLESPTGSAIFSNTADPKQSVAVICQKDVPRPPIPNANIEEFEVTNESRTATVTARLYHDSTPKDGTPIDEFIMRNPKNGLDIFIAGYGETFKTLLSTFTLQL